MDLSAISRAVDAVPKCMGIYLQSLEYAESEAA